MSNYCYLCNEPIDLACDSCKKFACSTHSEYQSGERYCSLCLERNSIIKTTFENAEQAGLKGDYDSAIIFYSEVINKYPESNEANIARSNINKLKELILDKNFIMTTSMFITNHKIEEEFGVVCAECVYGMNIFRDIFSSVRDVVGGRSAASEKVLQDARDIAFQEIQYKSKALGANAIIAVALNYFEISGGGKSGMLIVAASGTAVKVKSLIE